MSSPPIIRDSTKISKSGASAVRCDRGNEEQRCHQQRFFSSIMIGNMSGNQSADNASDNYIRDCPAGFSRRQLKVLTQRLYGT